MQLRKIVENFLNDRTRREVIMLERFLGSDRARREAEHALGELTERFIALERELANTKKELADTKKALRRSEDAALAEARLRDIARIARENHNG